MVALAKSFVVAVIAASTVSALPHLNLDVHLPKIQMSIAAKLNRTGTLNIIEADRARATHLINHATSLKDLFGKRQQADVDASNTAVSYSTSVNIGDPATACECEVLRVGVHGADVGTDTLLIDTGSSNTWLGADKQYTPTSTSSNTGKSVVRRLASSALAQ